jgi:RNA polymerase sigma-70 factor, ECF subfamily
MRKRDVDDELVAQVLRGDKAAFDALTLKYQHKIVKLLSRYLHNPAEILDVTQEVFIKAYRSLHQFRNDSAFYTWLYRIAVNTAKNYIVNQAKQPQQSELPLEDGEQQLSNKLKEYASPENLLLRDEIEKTVLQAVDELPEELRVAITLRELEGMSYEEIAAIMQCPVGTIRSRLYRAREIIDAKLQPLLKDK